MNFNKLNLLEFLDDINEGVYFAELDGKIAFWNKGAEKITGYKSSEVIGKRCSENILIHINAEGKLLCLSGCPLANALNSGKSYEADMFLKHKNGYRVPVSVHTAPLKDNENKIVGVIEIFTDNSQKIVAEKNAEKFKRLAMFDGLTELPNRRFIDLRLEEKLSDLKRYGWNFGVIFFDIDDFKKINDRCGHKIADRVLMTISRTLAKNIRLSDFIGRWGGDEFIAIISFADEETIFKISKKYKVLIENSRFFCENEKIMLTISIGATISKNEDTSHSIMKRVDELMYKSKSSGKNTITIG